MDESDRAATEPSTFKARLRRLERSRTYLIVLALLGVAAIAYFAYHQGYDSGAKDGIAWHSRLQDAYVACLATVEPTLPAGATPTGTGPGLDNAGLCLDEAMATAGSVPVGATFSLSSGPTR